MMRKVLLYKTSNLTASLNLPFFCRLSVSCSRYSNRRFFSDRTADPGSQPQTRDSELPRVGSLVDGCDYKHWLVVMHPPENYPQREEIVQQYVATLALALGSEKSAMESIYSVSTKYYYGFSCKVPENVILKIKSFPRVKWVLPDSFLCTQENGYGGEPYVDGKVVPYDDKYHAEWLRDNIDEGYTERTFSRKLRRRRKGSRNSNVLN
ncbi:Multiple organellar RNA editing factor 7, mitochondrial [Orobanche hederae]